LMNLVHNAIKFSPSGKTVSVDIERKNDGLMLRVCDEGTGLPEDKATIFGSYSMQNNRDSVLFGGVGLGLYIVKCNVDILGGCIEVSSAEQGGAVFVVTVGVVKDEG